MAGTVTTFMGSTHSISKEGNKATITVRPGYNPGKHLVQIDTPDGRLDWTVSEPKQYARSCTIGMVDGFHPNLAACFEKFYKNDGDMKP